jgi:hypothetical protein
VVRRSSIQNSSASGVSVTCLNGLNSLHSLFYSFIWIHERSMCSLFSPVYYNRKNDLCTCFLPNSDNCSFWAIKQIPERKARSLSTRRMAPNQLYRSVVWKRRINIAHVRYKRNKINAKLLSHPLETITHNLKLINCKYLERISPTPTQVNKSGGRIYWRILNIGILADPTVWADRIRLSGNNVTQYFHLILILWY